MQRTPRRIVLAFSIGSIGTGIYLTVPGVLLLYYLTEILSVSPVLAGLAVFLPRVWDMITDPFMGWVSDRTRSPIGRRRPYLLAGGILTALSFVFLFSAPELPGERLNFLYVVVIYVLSATAYTVFAVPYLSMPAEMSQDPDERASIMAYRMSFAMAGVLAGSAAAPALLEAFGGGRAGFAGMSWVLGGACAATMLIAFFGTARAPVVPPPADAAKARFLDALKDGRFRMLALAYIIQLGGLGVFTGATPYYVTHIAGRSEGAMSTVFLALLGGTILSMFAWAAIARLTGKVPAYLAAALITVAGLAGLWLASGPDDWPLVIAMTGVVGMGFGGLQLLPFAMLTDIIHDAREKGRDAAGTFTGVWTAVEKGGLALGPLVVGLVLGTGGFVSGAEAQSDRALFWIRIAVALIPSALALLSVPAVLRYRTDMAQTAAEPAE